MNTAILLKCIEELKTDKPRLDYILGMLETLYEMSSLPGLKEKLITNAIESATVTTLQPLQTNEASLLDAQARAAIVEVQRIAKESQ